MPHIQQNRYPWLMRYEYGATVNAPSKKGPAGGWSPLFVRILSRYATTKPAQGRGAMVAFANGNCGRVRTGTDSASGWLRSNSLRRSKKLERKYG